MIATSLKFICRKEFRTASFFLLFSLILSMGCKQNSSVNTTLNIDDNGGYASDISRIQLFTDDAISLADVAGNYYNAVYIGSSCATVATDTFSSPHMLTIRFGDNVDCICLDGRKRRGNISVSYSGEYLDTASVHTIQFDNYYIDGYQVTGTIKYVRVDTTVVGDWYYKVTVNDSVTITPDQYVVWKGSLVRKWVSGSLTGDRTDDAFSISGNATLTRPNSHTFPCALATPLQVNLNCNYVESGIINVSATDGLKILNYGSGGCDNVAQLNIGANPYVIALSY